MPVPDFQSLMLPVLKALACGEETHLSEIRERVAKTERLTPEDKQEMVPNGRQTTLADRVGWSITHLKSAGLAERVRRAVYRSTGEGERLLAAAPARIDMAFLRDNYPAYAEWSGKASAPSSGKDDARARDEGAEATPEEALLRAADELRRALEADVLDRVRNAEPAFLEQAIVDLLIAMGYGDGDAGAGWVTGRSGDGGIDGKIREDALGLDEVHIQAKRYAHGNTIGPGDLRGFAGALDTAGTDKGVFVTTSSFTEAAKDYIERSPKRIVLIDGPELARLMVRHNIGARVRETVEIKETDENYFDPDAP